ncbi:HD-GYP domain-containing protein [uncultured Enterobacter sp.]|uniref:HD-GYP domain-containing protein n=1 Tax=uncultured Enterobacter sp. TaxID=238202 RepID=UPI00260F7977|nr:HD-GYP domain-containing protein [uncultured Enterobacter sp.]
MVFNINNTLILIAKTAGNEPDKNYLPELSIAYIAYRLAQHMGKPDLFCNKSVICALLLNHNVAGSDNNSLNGNQRLGHPSRLSNNVLFRKFFTPIMYHNFSYNDVEMLKIKKEDSLQASILRLSYEFESHLRKNNLNDFLFLSETHMESATVLESFLSNVNSNDFYPGLLHALSTLVELDDFWFYFRPDYIEGLIRSLKLERIIPSAEDEQNIILAGLIASIVDSKSTLTYQHSRKVGELAKYIGKKLHLDSRMCFKLYLAGFLHDVGKIGVPDVVLNKCGKLSKTEYRIIQRHVTDTRGILQSILVDQDIIDWASEHHERLDGTGYPLKKKGDKIALPSRIIAICDIFQALCQKRTYRESLPLHKVLCILENECKDGKICNDVLNVILRNATECFKIAV